ncbi:MAG: hypothetical protein SF051_06215 [Elusimicrobiota bacterium]|nr:hypothetical protein [Elusimicrobiota bacterium]
MDQAYERELNVLFGEDPVTSAAPDLSPEQRLRLVLRLFESSGALPGRFGDKQVAKGLVHAVSSGHSDDLTYLTDSKLDEVLRLRVIAAMKLVFKDCFAPRCTPHLAHLDEKSPNPLNSTCYMWWEHTPLFGRPGIPEYKNIDAAAIDVMRDSLRIPSVAVQEASLHGLGHWVPEYPAVAIPIIDDYLANQNIARPELVTYAKRARAGMIN